MLSVQYVADFGSLMVHEGKRVVFSVLVKHFVKVCCSHFIYDSMEIRVPLLSVCCTFALVRNRYLFIHYHCVGFNLWFWI